ncbi:potassium channel family protein [Mucilaginibacter sp. PAMB04274]|uniref:potassium channel family protein n=1 Tax=Mucilaginibacter sp. PAMB04274 TaxID=3138568 RepID=UPI0031F6B1B1
MQDNLQFQLPKIRRVSIIELIDRIRPELLVVYGLALYVVTVLFFTAVELVIGLSGNIKPCPVDGWDLLYFNFVSILTIGYGDLSPKGIFRVLTIIEAMIGLAIYSLAISVITLKMLLPRKHTIVFSKFAYYSTKDKAFLIIYLNTARQFITNLETTWYFKLNEDWKTGPPSRVPFITTSVQTFYLRYELELDKIVSDLHPFDCLRVGLSGGLGVSNYSTYVQYDLDKILVIPDREELKAYEGFYQVDDHLSSTGFRDKFHYRPDNAASLADLLAKRS